MRINSSHAYSERKLDAYFTPIEAVRPLLKLEQLPKHIWEPACGDGAIVKPLREAGHTVYASDIANYEFDCYFHDYLTTNPPIFFEGVIKSYDPIKVIPPVKAEGIVTNPPFKLAQKFAEKALNEVTYVALLLRLSFLESQRRIKFFKDHPPTRIWISSRRLPMMHRHGWTGKKSTSNTCYAWFIWDRRQSKDYTDMPLCTRTHIKWFDWKDYE